MGKPRRRSKPRRILFVGTQWELKGGPLLLKAFSELEDRHTDLELTIVGVNPSVSSDRIRVLGKLAPDRMQVAYESADLLVIPTNQEAYGIAITEALMSGIPCVGTTVGNQQGLIADAGICIPPDDLPALTAAIEHIIQNFNDYVRRAERRGSELQASNSWDAVGEAILKRMSLTVPTPDKGEASAAVGSV